LKYCSRLKRLMRLAFVSVSPSATQTRASCASKSSAVRNCTGCVATTGRPSSAASGTAARSCASCAGMKVTSNGLSFSAFKSSSAPVW